MVFTNSLERKKYLNKLLLPSKNFIMPSGSLRDHIHFLERLRRARTPQRLSAILRTATKDQIDLLSELAANICVGNCNLKKTTYRRLLPHKNYFRSLGRARTTRQACRVIQRGGAFPLLALAGALAAPLIKSAAEEAIAQGVPFLVEKGVPFLKDTASDIADTFGDITDSVGDFANNAVSDISNFFGKLF